LTPPKGKKRYIAAAFPSACGKTNLAMLTPPAHLPGWKVECVGDDIAWMKFDGDGRLRAINPENGFFGVAPGTNMDSNPNAMKTIFKNTIFTNTAVTSDGGVYWEGMEGKGELPNASISTWKGGKDWQLLNKSERKAGPASHPNARFCTPISQYPHLDENWESSEGVPIDAILFGGRRPKTIPLVYESFGWRHGVFVGAGMKSETTAAAQDIKEKMAHDPFAMRPFFGYNFMHYLNHWLDLEKKEGVKLPKIFHVNWFRKEDGRFVWPGFGDNLRVLDWVLRRCDGEGEAVKTPLGYVPGNNGLNMEGLSDEDVNRDCLFKLSKQELQEDLEETEQYFDSQFPGQLPAAVLEELEAARQRIAAM
jgi:phosphoenolpyruvate carboxykinase (GTP)